MAVAFGVRDAVPGLDGVAVDKVELEGAGDARELSAEGREPGG
jgi:hypothetical protein